MKGTRLDKYLTETYKEKKFSRAQWQKLIKKGAVLVNEKTVTPHYDIKPNDKIKFKEAGSGGKGAGAGATKTKTKKRKIPKIKIIVESPDYIIIEKPAGVLVHAAPGQPNAPLLTDWILANYPEISRIKNDEGKISDRPGVVHRLDRETSGVMVVAKNQRAFDDLRAQFKTHAVEKTYIALVHGTVQKDSGVIDFAIGRSTEGKMAARPRGIKAELDMAQKGRESKTEFHVLERFMHYTLLEALPFTGRTHQIRVHFHALGHPIVGDPLYKYKGPGVGHGPSKNETKPPRMMLHSQKLCFADPADGRAGEDGRAGRADREKKCFESKPPKIMTDFIRTRKPIA